MRFVLLCFAALGVWAEATITTVPSAVNRPTGVAVDEAGNLYFREYQQQIKKMAPDGTVSIAVGNGLGGFSGDGGQAAEAGISTNGMVVPDGMGNLYLPDQYSNRIRKIGPDGIIRTVVGSGFGYYGDGGPAMAAGLSSPQDVALDSHGNLYICENSGQRIRKVDTNGIITTIGGNGTYGFSGDGGPAIAAQFWFPSSVAVDSLGNVYVADPLNQRVRRIAPNGIITTYAGTGVQGGSGDGGAASQATLYFPYVVRMDPAGNLLILERYGSRVRRVSPGGVITTVAGNGTYSNTGDGGPARLAGLSGPESLAVDSAGQIYIADTGNSVTRKVTPTPPVLPSVLETGAIEVSGMSPTVTVRFSHPEGPERIGVVNVLINRELNGDDACYLAWDHTAKVLYLVNDRGPASGLTAGLTLGQGTGSIGNSQCQVHGPGSSYTANGNTVTLTLALAFTNQFRGNRPIYVAARDRQEATSGWKAMGLARIPAAELTYPWVGEMTPVAGTGPAPLLTFRFLDQRNIGNLRTVWMLVNSSLNAPVSCYLAYSVPQNRLYLRSNSTRPEETTSMAMDGTGMIENSQCRVTGAGSQVSRVGNQLQLDLQMTFSPYFYGPRLVWGGAETMDGHGSGWTVIGAWLVP